MAKAKKKGATIDLRNLIAGTIGYLTVRIVGETDLLQNSWLSSSITGIEEGQQGKGERAIGKSPRKPENEFVEHIHFIGPRAKSVKDLNGKRKFRYGHPATGLELAMMRAAKGTDVSMSDAKTFFNVVPDEGNLVEIKVSKPPAMRTDPVSPPAMRGSATIAYRPAFSDWAMDVRIRYLSNKISAEQIIQLLANAGVAVGIGSWRKDGKGGTGPFGLFRLEGATSEVAG